MDVVDHLVRRRVDVAADDALAVLPAGELLQLLLVTAHETDGVLHLHFHPPAEREGFLVAPAQPGIVGAVQAQQQFVPHRPHFGQPHVVRGHMVKAVTMHDEIAAMR